MCSTLVWNHFTYPGWYKVPNVKLRPADKGAYARTVEESCWAQDTQPEDENAFTHDLCPRPLKGLSICATGVQDKPTLFKQAVELGATCTPAFTDRVTHLIAVDHGGAKYMCALERKIPIVKPSWISENYQIWLKGDDVDVEKSVEQHRLSIFSGVVVCPSGITDITRRTRISKLVTAHDGEYLKVLERPVRVTHLLCSGDEETDKMRYAEKFNSRGEAKIHLVWEEWFWDSIDFGGRFDESTYQVRRPRPERKSLPVVPSSSPPPTSDLPSQHDDIPSSVASRQPQSKNLEDAEDEPAFVNVLPVVTLQLWNSLLGRRGYEINDGEVILSPSKADPNGTGKKRALERPQPASPIQERLFGAERSVISTFRRTNSFAPAAPGSSRQLPFRRTSTAMAVMGNNKASTSALPPVAPLRKSNTIASSNAAPQQSVAACSPIFSGMKLRILGEAKSPTVRTAIEDLGGTISVDEDEDVDFIIVRLVSGSKLYREEEDEEVKFKYRTECWLEQCIYENRICGPKEQVSSVPLVIPLPVSGSENVLMALSGLDQSETCGLKRLLRALGITLSPTFTKRCTHLLCPSGTGLKFDKSREWGIPVINLEWLRVVGSSGVIPKANQYLVPGSVVLSEDEEMNVGFVRKEAKGKGKAVDTGSQRTVSEDQCDEMDVDVENRMQDITNDIPSESKQSLLPKKSLTIERREMIIPPTPSPPENMSFGMPNEILGGPAISKRQPSIVSASSHDVQSENTLSPRLSHKPSNASLNDQNFSSSSDSNPPSILRHRKTILNIDEERSGRIPSSKSPSPMKIPRNPSSRTSLSPVKIDHLATKALQESITSLLGKRPSPDSEEMGMPVLAGGGGNGVRNGKRPRPQRSKPQSRQPSDTMIAEAPPVLPTRRTRSSRLSQTPSAFGDAALNPFDQSYSEQLDDDDSQGGSSMRVMYEDPVQKEEKKRLLNLLKDQAGEDDVSSLNSDRHRRRSTRIAGF